MFSLLYRKTVFRFFRFLLPVKTSPKAHKPPKTAFFRLNQPFTRLIFSGAFLGFYGLLAKNRFFSGFFGFSRAIKGFFRKYDKGFGLLSLTGKDVQKRRLFSKCARKI